MFGIAGQISMGSAAFLAIGAFAATGGSLGLHLPFLAAVALGTAAAGLVGVAIGIPSLRLSSHYLLFSTLALHFIVISVLTRVQGTASAGWSLSSTVLGPLTDTVRGWVVVYAAVFVLTMWMVYNLRRGRPGRVWLMIREQMVGAALVGIDVARWRLIAFGFSAAVFGLIGGLQPFYLGHVSVDDFTFDLVIVYIAVVLVGGLGSIFGSIVGSIAIIAVPFVVAALADSPLIAGVAPQLQQQKFSLVELVYGVLLTGVLLVEPGGIAAAIRRAVHFVRARRGGQTLTGSALNRRSARDGLIAVERISRTVAIEPETDGLVVSGLTVRYGASAAAVDGISFIVRRGSVVALIGPNGAGKTTILRGIAGFLPREPAHVVANEVKWQGIDLIGAAPSRTARAGISFVPERDKVFAALSVKSNLAIRLPRGASERRAVLAQIHTAFPGLRALQNRGPAGLLSGGERQMLALAMAMAGRPSLLIIDEATLGLAPIAVAQLAETIKRLRALGVTMLLAEQNVRLALDVSDHLLAVANGRIVGSDPVKEWSEARLRQAYLGAAP
jgi:branched-chain amino acid transport system permease protein